jgi:release factor glutamine methyltransferase
VGTGSGAIALAVAANAENARIYALDVSQDALAVAAKNTATHDSRAQITLLHSDLLASLPEPVDVIVANLPYVTSADFRTLDLDVRKYEPQLALEAGEQGLDVIGRLLRQVTSHLCPGGTVFLEIGYDQGQAVLGLVADILPQALNADVHKDYQGRDRMVTFNF